MQTQCLQTSAGAVGHTLAAHPPSAGTFANTCYKTLGPLVGLICDYIIPQSGLAHRCQPGGAYFFSFRHISRAARRQLVLHKLALARRRRRRRSSCRVVAPDVVPPKHTILVHPHDHNDGVQCRERVAHDVRARAGARRSALFPAFGFPTRPTSKGRFSSTTRLLHSPFVARIANFGERFRAA